jgi:anti-sigma regulatory factor (Ser/Thr protein kinase)
MCWTAKSLEGSEATSIRRSIARYLAKRVRERNAVLEAEIVIGELLGNAARHAPGPICADVEWREDQCPVLLMHDAGAGFDEPPAPADRFAESGRGMHIVRSLTHALSVRRVRPRGCVVSAVLRLTKRPDIRGGHTPCPQGGPRSELGCRCALELHGLARDAAHALASSRRG